MFIIQMRILLIENEVYKMKKQKSVMLGVMAFLPLFYIVLSWILIIPTIFGPINNSASMERGMSQSAGLYMIMNNFFLIAIIIVIIAYVLKVRNNKSIHKRNKDSWTVLIIIGSAITIPIYWYKYILKGNRMEDGTDFKNMRSKKRKKFIKFSSHISQQ